MVYLAIVCFFRQKWPENSAKMEDEKIRSNRTFCTVMDYKHGKLVSIYDENMANWTKSREAANFNVSR